jgi:hypothetical protein
MTRPTYHELADFLVELGGGGACPYCLCGKRPDVDGHREDPPCDLAVLLERLGEDDDDSVIVSRRVVSPPGSCLEVTELELSPGMRAALSIGAKAGERGRRGCDDAACEEEAGHVGWHHGNGKAWAPKGWGTPV